MGREESDKRPIRKVDPKTYGAGNPEAQAVARARLKAMGMNPEVVKGPEAEMPIADMVKGWNAFLSRGNESPDLMVQESDFAEGDISKQEFVETVRVHFEGRLSGTDAAMLPKLLARFLTQG